MNDYCFVIQPFDKGKFDKRYLDVFAPSINQAGLEPYRIDNDDSVVIPIESIEEKIKNSRLCIADITTDNPNVWYEVGYALARDKDVILLCSDERTSSYPFDVRQRNILNYKTDSASDYKQLSEKLIRRIKAALAKPITISTPSNINIDIDGLSYPEISFLGAILTLQTSISDSVSAWSIKEIMKKEGLNDIAFNLAMRKLILKNYITLEAAIDYNGDEYTAYKTTDKGDEWILQNEDKFTTTILIDNSDRKVYEALENNDLPF